MANPYDELPYRSAPIEWTAPERLALASLLHGGPRLDVRAGYRVLELGCGDGANLLPMAWFRPHASFLGIDGAATQIAVARAHAEELCLHNLAYVDADFEDADAALDGRFDLVLAHGVLSWVPAATREALLRLCARRLRPGGLLYFNYNAKPGWNVRGMVREFLLAQTASAGGLRARADAAREVCRRLLDAMGGEEHAYRRLMIQELTLVRDGDVSYVAHEYLAPDNHAYWRSEITALFAAHGLEWVVDADFDQPWARMDGTFEAWLRGEGITGRSIEDTMDLFLYRQLASPILTQAPLLRQPPTREEILQLHVAARLAPLDDPAGPLPARFGHPSGAEVTVTDADVRDGLLRLHSLWPQGLVVSEAFPTAPTVVEDVQLLHRHGLVTLRLVEPEESDGEALHRIEAAHGGYRTSALHVREPVAAPG